MEDINLLQTRVKDTTYAWQKQSRWFLTGLWAILILLLGASAIFYLLTHGITSQTNTVSLDNSKLQSQISNQEQNLGSAKIFQAQLSNVHLLLNSHVYFSPLLEELGKNTYQKAEYLTLDAAGTGRVHLEGKVDNYSDLGKLLLGLSTSKQFSNLKLLSVVPSSGRTNAYIFALDLTVNPNLFTKK